MEDTLLTCVSPIYVDDCIIIGDSIILSLHGGNENFVLTDEWGIDKFLGIEITQLGDERFKIAQPFLIDRIILFIKIGIGMKKTRVIRCCF